MQCLRMPVVMNQLPYSYRFSITSGLFRSAGNGLESLTRTSNPSKVRPTVLSCTTGFPGNLLLSSLLIKFSQSHHTVFINNVVQVFFHFISSSIFTLLRPPRALCSVRPSIIIIVLVLMTDFCSRIEQQKV